MVKWQRIQWRRSEYSPVEGIMLVELRGSALFSTSTRASIINFNHLLHFRTFTMVCIPALAVSETVVNHIFGDIGIAFISLHSIANFRYFFLHYVNIAVNFKCNFNTANANSTSSDIRIYI